MAQAGDLLMMLTNAIEAARDLRNTTATVVGKRAGAANPPGPISDEPFSARIVKLHGSGGPQYKWNAVTTATPPNATVSANETVVVKFQTRYTRESIGFTPYSLHGQLELRNLNPSPVVIEVRPRAITPRRASRTCCACWDGGARVCRLHVGACLCMCACDYVRGSSPKHRLGQS